MRLSVCSSCLWNRWGFVHPPPPSETILSRLALAWREGLGKSGWGSRRGMPSSSTVGVEAILRDSSVTGGSSPLTCPQPGRGPACGSRGLALQGPPCCPLWLTGPLLQEKTLTKRGHLCFLGSRTGRGSVVKSVFKPVAMEVGWKDSGSFQGNPTGRESKPGFGLTSSYGLSCSF